MKNLVIMIMSLVALNVNAQLVVKATTTDSVVWQLTKFQTVPKIVKFNVNEMESYTIYYRNMKYTQIVDIDYLDLGDLETAKQFFELCKKVAVEKEDVSIQLNKESIMLSKASFGGVTIWKNGSYFQLTMKALIDISEKL
jgi:hypothetical protein